MNGSQTKDTKPTVTMRCLKKGSRQRAAQMRRIVLRKQQIIQKQFQIPQTQRDGRCQNCVAQRPHDEAHEGNRRREHLMRRSYVQDSTTDRSIIASMSASRSVH